jgi:hypothetical protein
MWIGTADIKDLHVHHKGTVPSFLSVLDSLAKKKVAIRLLHAKEPGVNFYPPTSLDIANFVGRSPKL